MHYFYLMTMDDAVTRVTGIEYKIRKLMDLIENHSIEREKMTDEILKLKLTNEDQKKKIEQLEEKVNLLVLAGPAVGSDHGKVAKARINELLREIDKCIGLINT